MSSQISPDRVSLALVDDDAMALAHLESYFPTSRTSLSSQRRAHPAPSCGFFSRIRSMSSSPMSTWRTWTAWR